MQNLAIILMDAAVSLAVSLSCWFVVSPGLRSVLAFLCDDEREGVKETGSRFWQRLYGGLTVFIPLLCVLLFAPNFGRSLADNLLYALRWSVFGGVSLLLMLAYLVQKQIRLNRLAKQPPAPADTNAPSYRLQQLAAQQQTADGQPQA
ncbi:Uncharacterised protein [Kingella potus]|uniref:Uncharacterized protein n=1 Tax=Kingella potus TaxID=265175 RepID=A0A377R417_9NEIS|nr:hypothetical protein [Kingella potus]UOP00231.1 hypothetical protein LVJ84_09885 [Kingella potus]STR02712.1 Uncharacterised protein [Kingella potus]